MLPIKIQIKMKNTNAIPNDARFSGAGKESSWKNVVHVSNDGNLIFFINDGEDDTLLVVDTAGFTVLVDDGLEDFLEKSPPM